MKKLQRLVGLSLFLAACATGSDGSSTPLQIQSDKTHVTGTYTQGDARVRFSSTEVEGGVFDVVIDVNGMTLSALIDRNHQVAEVDGFAGTGGDTQILDADRALLGRLGTALDEQLDGEQPAAGMLLRLVSNWSQTPTTVPLQRQVAGSENRGWTSLCSSKGSYVKATHDDNNYARNAARSTSNGHVGLRSSTTEYYVSGRWITTTQNHVAGLYERGNCFGNCGAGCPGGTQTLTLDCHDHDQCVRNGHALASAYCDDEFVSASDDEFFAPRCSGT
jgi:hypothetical protein